MSSQATPTPRSPRSPLVEFLLAAAGASTAALFSNPFEVIKTRMQLQGELVKGAAAVYRSPWHAATVMVKTEGIKSLLKGLSPAILYMSVMNGTRLGSYGRIKAGLSSPDDTETAFFLKNLLSGASAGVLGAYIGSPFFLIKIRLQTASTSATKIGYQHNYSGVYDAARKIVKADGVRGLWRGVNGQVLRIAAGSSVQLSTYDSFKRLLLELPGFEDNTTTHLTAAALGSLLVTLAMNPFDVLTSRIMNQEVINGRGVLYSGVRDCFTMTVRTEGTMALFKGLPAHAMRLLPHTVATFVFWEWYKKMASDAGY